MTSWRRRHRVEVTGKPAEVLEAVGEAADIWCGEWRPFGTGGHLTIPVSVGLRRGSLSGDVSTRPLGANSELTFHVQESQYKLHIPALVVLLMGAAGGLILVAWPFFPVLIGLTPAGLVLMFAAWFLVASRLKTRGPAEFFELLAEIQDSEDPRSPSE